MQLVFENFYFAVSSPCRGIICQHNGKCLADFKKVPVTFSCICTSAGFVGKNCGDGEYNLLLFNTNNF
jgi:hypothetical protein